MYGNLPCLLEHLCKIRALPKEAHVSGSLKRVPREAEQIATRSAGEVKKLNRAAPMVNDGCSGHQKNQERR